MQTVSLENGNGFKAVFTNYGATLMSLMVPDSNGIPADVVLGFAQPEDYLKDHPYFGAICGRIAGRLTSGQFHLDGQAYKLEINNPPNHLHGGRQGFDKRLWKVSKMNDTDSKRSIVFCYDSPDGEEGYPGNLHCEVTYSLTDEGALVIDYYATSDKPTPFNPTNHSYFNLSGENCGSTLGHSLRILADDYFASDDNMTLLPGHLPVDGKPNDFRKSQFLSDAVPALHKQHGDLYRLRDNPAETPQIVATLTDPESGRVMEVSTTERCLQFYSAMALDGQITGKSGTRYMAHAGVCLECQGHPDAINVFPDDSAAILHPSKPYHQTTIYQFSTL